MLIHYWCLLRIHCKALLVRRQMMCIHARLLLLLPILRLRWHGILLLYLRRLHRYCGSVCRRLATVGRKRVRSGDWEGGQCNLFVRIFQNPLHLRKCRCSTVGRGICRRAVPPRRHRSIERLPTLVY
jgi:hypothetical protein